ncbi:polyprotein pp220, partial [Elysia marginata]
MAVSVTFDTNPSCTPHALVAFGRSHAEGPTNSSFFWAIVTIYTGGGDGCLPTQDAVAMLLPRLSKTALAVTPVDSAYAALWRRVCGGRIEGGAEATPAQARSSGLAAALSTNPPPPSPVSTDDLAALSTNPPPPSPVDDLAATFSNLQPPSGCAFSNGFLPRSENSESQTYHSDSRPEQAQSPSADEVFDKLSLYARRYGAHPDFRAQDPATVYKAHNFIKSTFGYGKNITSAVLEEHLHSLAAGLNQAAGGVATLGQSAATFTAAAQSAIAANKGVYALVQAHVAKEGGGFTGGYFGGDPRDEPSKALKEYRDSLAAATKDRIIRGLARALSRAGIDVNPDASAEDIARALVSKLPNPRNNGKTFAADAKAQEKVCRTVADVLNDEFTPGASAADKLIDTSLGAVAVCRQVAELVHSLSTGLQTEFLEVHASLTRVLRNLEVLDEILQELHNKIRGQVVAADLPVGADKKIADFEEIYARAQRERERQMAMLRNFLNVTLAPAKEELAIAMRDESLTHDMVSRLQLVPGTGDFANTLAHAISGLGTVAAVSARVDKALKEVGMSVQQYLSSDDISSLETSLDMKLMGGVAAEDVGRFLKAVQTLKENFYRRSELALDEASSDGADGATSFRGGEDASTLDRRVEARKMEKKLIVKDFIAKTAGQYDALLKSVQILGPLLGKTVPLSDKLESFRNALASLSQVRMGSLSLELALLGYYGDAEHREKKENFISGLRAIQGLLDDLMSMEMYGQASQYFAAVRAAIDGLLRTIDFYSDVIAKKYGSGGDEETAENKKVGGDSGLASIPEIARSSYDLENAINTFLYFYYVAKVRTNLAQTRTELEFYGEKYVDILGDAVAARLRQLEREKADALSQANLDPSYKTFVEASFESKTSFYRALQALDLYMKSFTDGIVANPDDVADAKRMLDGVSVIGRWFIEDTGDDLAAAFDMMPAWDGASRQNTALGNAGHYYQKLVDAGNIRNDLFLAGVPQLAVESSRADAIYKQVAKVYDNFQALKNITNAFVRIGEKFGGKELRRQVFMSPTQMYKAFLEYLKRSALSMLPARNNNNAAVVQVLLTNNSGGAAAAAVRPAVRPAANPLEGDVFFGSVLPGLAGNYAVEDKYFSFCVKAMAAKVLTVIGVFDLFERPNPVYELTPTRMIIGGADYDAVPEVIPEASELYFRLPRLVEFYKDLFDWKGDLAQISMLPEVEGVFSGIIRLIFNRVQGGAAASGDYSDLEVRSIVREINAIYENFRSAGGANREALSAFVVEINRRYGVVKKKDWDALQALLKNERRGVGGPQGTQTNYAILPGEEEFESDRRAPSDRYLGPGVASKDDALVSKFTVDGATGADDWGQWQMLKAFREKLDAKFASVHPDEFTTYSFSTVIRQGEIEMRRAEDASARIGVVARLIQGSGNLAGIDVGKSFMFHETVVVGLNTLSGLFTLLKAFKQRVVDTDVVGMRALVKAWVNNRRAAPNNPQIAFSHAALSDAVAGPLKDLSSQARSYVRTDNSLFSGWGGAGDGLLAVNLYTACSLNANAMTVEITETLATYCFDDSAIMRDLLTVISGLTTAFQGLVVVRFPSTAAGQIHLDFSGLRGLVQKLMSDIRAFMDLFRRHIAKSTIS